MADREGAEPVTGVRTLSVTPFALILQIPITFGKLPTRTEDIDIKGEMRMAEKKPLRDKDVETITRLTLAGLRAESRQAELKSIART